MAQDWIGTTYTSRVGWGHLEQLVDIGDRMAGSEGERDAAAATSGALAAQGARNTERREFEIQGWRRGAASIDTQHTAHSCIALPRSPSGAVEGRLVDLGHGLPAAIDAADVEGQVVMVASDVPSWADRFVHRREKYYHAVAAGAAGFVFRNHIEGGLAPTGSVGTETAPIGAIPAVGVSKEVGARLARTADGDAVTLRVDCETPKTTSQNVHADVGPETDQAVLLTCHVDAHDIAEGAVDNAAGTAMLVELTRALRDRASELETRVHLLGFGAEEVGLVGSSLDATERAPERIRAVVNLDGVVRARTLKLLTNGFEALEQPARVAAGRFDHPVSVVPRMSPHSDHWPYVARGVPGYHVKSETTTAGRGWGHTAADTIDKLDIRDLREQAIVLNELLVQLTDGELSLPRRTPGSIADQLRAEDLAAGMQATGDWPF